jgi:hypothetical protein
MSNLRRIWTADDDAQLRSLMESGASVGLVAAKLKRTVKAVRGQSKLGGSCARRSRPGERKERI